MISFISVKIKSLDSYTENLKAAIPKQLIDTEAIDVLKKYLGVNCDEIRVEYPYYDGDYLSTFYIHYAQKLRPYEKMCCRLHILKNEEYYGYITLRPTTKGTKIGKTFLMPELVVKDDAYLTLHTFKAHIVGNEMDIRSFPWKSQETDISVCAHTATWTVIRYFGNKFRNYADTTIGEVVEHTRNDWGRKTPSLGLTPVQVSDLFKEYNFSPLILQHEKDKDSGFLEEIVAYIESGLPMVGFLYPIKHAISIIGHGIINKDILDDETTINMLKDEEINVISHSKLIQDLYVMDDNCFPYRKMPLSLPSEESDVVYGITELEYVVVPLYRRMQLVYSEVYERFRLWRKEKVMDWEELCVCRIYITFPEEYKTVIDMLEPMISEKELDKITVESLVRSCIEVEEQPIQPVTALWKTKQGKSYSTKASNIKVNLKFALASVFRVKTIMNQKDVWLGMAIIHMIVDLFTTATQEIDEISALILIGVYRLQHGDIERLNRYIMEISPENMKELITTHIIEESLGKLEGWGCICCVGGEYVVNEIVTASMIKDIP